jgi:cell division protease FtsH
MSDRVGTLSVLPSEGDPRMAGISENLLNVVDEEVRRLVDDCFAEARRLLRENRPKLDSIVERLLASETLDEAEVYAAANIPRASSSGATAVAVKVARPQVA